MQCIGVPLLSCLGGIFTLCGHGWRSSAQAQEAARPTVKPWMAVPRTKGRTVETLAAEGALRPANAGEFSRVV